MCWFCLCSFGKVPCRLKPPISFSSIVLGLWFMSIKARSFDITANSLFYEHCRNLKLVFSLVRVRNSKSFSQTSVICFCRGFSCCPYYWGVCYNGVSARPQLTVFCSCLWINTVTIIGDKFTNEQKILEEICLE